MTLISGTELAGRLGGPNLRIIDTRWSLGRPGAGREAYEAGHIPGAIHLDLDTDLSAPPGQGAIGGLGRHPLPSPQAFAARMAAAGIGDDDLVVAYDESDGGVAARLWWMLDALGHERVAVLDGGWRAWLEAGLPVSTEPTAPTEPTEPVGPTEPPHPTDPTTATDRPPARLHLAAAWPRTIERRDLAERLGSVVLLDARAPERYRGEIEPIDPLAGHIPTARNSPLARNIGPDGRFLDPEILRARFASLGVGRPQAAASGPAAASASGAASGSAAAPPSASGSDSAAAPASAVVYCGSGTNACQLALAMRVAGLPDPLLYVGSFSDWSRSGAPVVTGDDPGDPPSG